MPLSLDDVDAARIDYNNPDVLDSHVADLINLLISKTDPRLVVNALLSNTATLCELVQKAGKATPAQVAQVFSSALIQALTPSETQPEAPRIEVVSASVLPLR